MGKASTGFAVCMGLGMAGCAGFDSPPPELKELLAARPLPTTSQGRVVGYVRVDSEQLSGEFRTVIMFRRGPIPGVRMQLLPHLGGPVLDVAASANRLVATARQAEYAEEVDLTTAATMPREPLLFLAATLLETYRGVDIERLVGARKCDHGWEVLLSSSIPGLDLIASLDERGRLFAYEFQYKFVSWRETLHDEGQRWRIEGSGLSMDFRSQRLEPVPTIPDSVFKILRDEPR